MTNATRRELIELAVEFALIRSYASFADFSAKAQGKILAQMHKWAIASNWEGEGRDTPWVPV